MKEQDAIFKRMKEIKDYWVDASVSALDTESDLIWSEYEAEYRILGKSLSEQEKMNAYKLVLDEVIKGVMHSIFVMIDGGDELADSFNIDIIETDSKISIKQNDALHEEFFGYLLEHEEYEKG